MSYQIPTLKNKRILAQLTQEQLAELASTSRQTIFRLERGESCNRTTVDRLSSVLGLKMGIDVMKDLNYSEYEPEGSVEIAPSLIDSTPLYHTVLCEKQLEALRYVYDSFSDVLKDDFEVWSSTFKNDHPALVNQEILLWLDMGYAYRRFMQVYILSKPQRSEAYQYILLRSMRSKASAKKTFNLEVLTKSQFKKLESLCKFKARSLELVKSA